MLYYIAVSQRYVIMLCFNVILQYYVVILKCFVTMLCYNDTLKCYVIMWCYNVHLQCYVIMLCYNRMVRHPRCVCINYNWINEMPNTTVWLLDICCLLHRYQLHKSRNM